MGALVPIAGGGASAAGPVPFLRVIPGGLGAAAPAVAPLAGTAASGGLVGAAGAVGGVVGPVAAVLGAFALGFAAGKLLLAAWELLNRTGGDRPATLDPNNIDTWPLPNPATGLSVSWTYRSEGYFDPVVRDRISGVATLNLPFIYGVIPDGYYAGLDYASIDWGNGTAGGGVSGGGSFRLDSVNNPSGAPIPPRLVPGDPAPPRDRPLELLQRAADSVGVPLPAPLAFVPPARPVIAPAPSRAPVVTPAPIIPPAPVPRPAPSPGVPAPATQPGQLPRITPAPGTSPAPAPQPVPFPTIDPSRPVVPIGPDGLPVPAPPAPVPVTPPWLAPYPGAPVGEPAQRPRPDLDGIATELGRVEQKQAELLRRTGPASDLGDQLKDKLEELLRDWLDNVPGDSYQLVPACPPPGGSDPLPPVVVSWGSSDNATEDLRKRLDAIAALIQAHKSMGQPTCQTPITGSEVTVHFESP